MTRWPAYCDRHGGFMSGALKSEHLRLSDTHIEELTDGGVDVIVLQDPFRRGFEAVKSLAEKL